MHPNCSDRVKNQNEQQVDCGGKCAPCDDCTDGILNQDEEETDCGGSACKPCPTCEDGEMNGSETGVDCGGGCVACKTTACKLPLTMAEIGYIPFANGRDTLYQVSGNVYTSSFTEGVKFALVAGLPYRGWSMKACEGFTAEFYGDAVLNMPHNTTQVFLTADPNGYNYASADYFRNRCIVHIDMPAYDLPIQADQKVYITRVADDVFNINFCKLPVPKTYDYTLNTSFSVNFNFSLNQ